MTALRVTALIPRLHPVVAAEHYPATAVADTLRQIAEAAQAHAPIWREAGLAGFDHLSDPGPLPGAPGTSLAYAAQVGVGFWHEGPSLHAKAEQATVIATGRSATALFALDVAVEQVAGFAYGFFEGYRRRLAYGLAYEATLSAGSLAPITGRLAVLLQGTHAELEAVLPPLTQLGAFSIALNLLHALQHALRVADHGPNSVIDSPRKQTLLEHYLQATEAARAPTLTGDGQAALKALRVELAIIAARPVRPQLDHPIWGNLAGSQTYWS